MSCPFCLPSGERSTSCLHPLTVEEALEPKRAYHRSSERIVALRRMIARLEEDREDWDLDDRSLHRRLKLDLVKEQNRRLGYVRQMHCGLRPQAS
jgi:hypothetical protein